MLLIPRVWHGVACGLVVVSTVVGVGASSAAATVAPSSPQLSHAVLAQSLPGFSVVPGAQFNGTIPKSDLANYAGGAQWQGDVADGKLSGFVRAWSRQYTRGLAFIYDSAFRMPDAAYASVFTSTMTASADRSPAATAWAVKGIPGVAAYRTSPPAQVGRSAGYWIIFTKGSTGFLIYAVGPPRTVPTAALVRMARQQAARG